MFQGKKAIVIGERDGVQGPAIANCLSAAGAQVVYITTECFVWTAAGAMDAEAQATIKKIVEDAGSKDNFIVVLGASDLEGAEISAETVTVGDPSYAGPLAGVSLGLPVYHILEPEIKSHIPEDVYSESIGIMAMVINPEEVGERFKIIREKYANPNV